MTHGLGADDVVIVVVVTCVPAVSDEAVGVGAAGFAVGDDGSNRTTPPVLCVGPLYIRCRTPAKLGVTSENVCPRMEDGLLLPHSDVTDRRP